MISLICYGVLNLSAGIETLIANPSWRPRVRVHPAISIGGAILCLIAMLMIASGYALLSLFLVGIIYFVIKKREYQASWFDIQQGILLFFSRSIIYRLAYGTSASKSWRPHFLVFTKLTEEHSTPLLKFSESISQSKGFLTMASFIPPGMLTLEKQKEMQKTMASRFQGHNIQSFVKVNEAKSVTLGMEQMIEYYGLGPLMPNTILFGGIKTEEESVEFARVIQGAFARHYNIVIMNDDQEMPELKKQGQEIHLWWDDQNRDNSDLMLILAYMLQGNPGLRKTRIFLKAIVSDELLKKEKLNEFEKLSIEKRLPINVEVYVSSASPDEKLELVKEFSRDAAMVLLSLQAPPKRGSSLETYSSYLDSLSLTTKALPSLVLVLSSEHTPLDVILQ